MTRRWTSVGDLTAVLRKRWAAGRYLRPYARGSDWEPVALPVKAPTAKDLLDDFDSAVQWADRFRHDSHGPSGTPRFRVETKTIRGRTLGANSVPARIHLDSFEQLCALLGTAGDVEALDAALRATIDEVPDLVPWVVDHPIAAIDHQVIWEDVLATVSWIAAHGGSHLYLRHIDVPGVDTKFVERHRRLLDRLLNVVLPDERVNHSETNFARRYGFRSKPNYVRFRLLSPVDLLPSQITEMRLRTDELAALHLPVDTVFVVENEVSYLAFPEIPHALAIFGEGFGLTILDGLPWLHRKEIVYWGDIDTHGFVILNRLRARFDSVQSILMDDETLLAHPHQHVTESEPTNEQLPHLTPAESSLYRDLVENRFGRSVRLEQERIRFSLVRQSLRPWTPGPSRS